MSTEIDQTRHAGTFVDVDKLRGAKVMVGGAGALGNEVIKNLMLLGVGHLLVVDYDTIEPHNLSRSVFFAFGDREAVLAGGQPKAEFLASMVRSVNPAVSVAVYHGDIRDLGTEVFREMDVAFSCFDALIPRVAMNERCARAGIPMIDGGLGHGFDYSLQGEVQVIDTREEGPCYYCRLTRNALQIVEMNEQAAYLGCAEIERQALAVGSVPTNILMSSVIGAAQVTEGLKHVTGKGIHKPQHNKRYLYDLSGSGDPRVMEIGGVVKDYCQCHWSIPAEQVHALDAHSGEITLEELLARACEFVGRDDEVAVELPYLLYPEVECNNPECGKKHPWYSARWRVAVQDFMLGQDGKPEEEREPLPENLRLPCGCERSWAVPVGRRRNVDKYFGDESDMPCKATLRELGFPWGTAYGIWDGEEAQTAGYLVPSRDRDDIIPW